MGLGQDDRGYAMAALLVGLSIMAVLMSAALPVWSQFAKREKEEELIWRGQQYARAIGLFQRKYANTFPPNIDILVEQRFLRKKYKDPITNDDFQPIPAVGGLPPGGQFGPGTGGGQGPQPGQQGQQGQQAQQAQRLRTFAGRGQSQVAPFGGSAPQPAIGIQGVVSKSNATSIKVYNGRTRYNEWAFVYLATAQRIGMPNAPGQLPLPPGAQAAPGTVQLGGVTFRPLQGSPNRPGIGGPPGGPGMTFPQMPPGQQPPMGMPRFGPSPFGQPGQPPPGGQAPSPFGRPPSAPPSRPPGV